MKQKNTSSTDTIHDHRALQKYIRIMKHHQPVAATLSSMEDC